MRQTEAAWEFLLYAYFALTKDDFANEAKDREVCVARAYPDLSRTVPYRLTAAELDTLRRREHGQDSGRAGAYMQMKTAYLAEMTRLIVSQTEMLEQGTASFERWHGQTCVKIIDLSQRFQGLLRKKLSYGQAQKWLNMSMKYMWLLGMLDDYTQSLHVPVDRYVMEAAGRLGISVVDKDGQYQPYQETVSKPWSQWDREEYIKFQSDLRRETPSPIEWESSAWIKAAERQKGQSPKRME